MKESTVQDETVKVTLYFDADCQVCRKAVSNIP
jgi:predicted DCC family thiol-disulfide oxidoreductase YuxK